MNLWRPIDALADWLRHTFGVQAQVRMGVLMTLAGTLYLAYAPFTPEQKNIYTMSALALLFAGIGVVVSAETLREVASGPSPAPDDAADRCSTCGQAMPAD